MMKKICTHLRIVFTFLVIIAAGNNFAYGQCNPASARKNIDINNIRARINNGGDMFWDLTSSAKFEAPKVNEPGIARKHTIFASALWIGGYSNGNLKTAAMTYRQSGSDFWPGPLETANASIDQAECNRWDKIWKIERTTIDSFKAGLLSSIPADFLTWPAHGDVSKGQSKYLAPFVDVNNNGEYEPSSGDYPAIKGDQMLWWVFNDKGNIHTETQGAPLGIEVHASSFAYLSTEAAISNTIFVEYKIFNRSKDRLDSVYVGNWTDFDIGYGFDDYIGSDSSLNAYFGYNGDNMDEGPTGYGLNPPAQAVLLLDKKLNKFISYDNTSSAIGNPIKSEDYYRYLNGRWKDNKQLTYGGNGRFGSNAPVDYMYPSNPTSTDPNDWNESIAGNLPGDRRGLGSTGPLNIEPQSMEKFTYAYVFTRIKTGTSYQLRNDLIKVKDFYNDNLTTTINEPTTVIGNISVYPNPANENIFVSSGNHFTTSLRLINAVGQEVFILKNLKSIRNSFSIRDLPQGFYTLMVETENGVTAKKLLISR